MSDSNDQPIALLVIEAKADINPERLNEVHVSISNDIDPKILVGLLKGIIEMLETKLDGPKMTVIKPQGDA